MQFIKLVAIQNFPIVPQKLWSYKNSKEDDMRNDAQGTKGEWMEKQRNEDRMQI